MSGLSTAHNFTEKARTADVRLDESVDFAGLLLSERVLQGLSSAGFERPSPIQLKAIPLGRCGLDLIVQAKSGTGKTCVFSVVALESVLVESNTTQTVVLAPTREIAVQIWEVLNSVGAMMPELRCYTFIGGLPLTEDKQKLKKCHIAVGTPGRVKQLIEIGELQTDNVRLFVLDEADKMMEDGMQETVNWIYSSLPQNKQMLAVSATYPEVLAQHLTAYMRNPTFIRLNTSDPALLGIRQYYRLTAFHPVQQKAFQNKVDCLLKLLSSVTFDQCLVFSNYQMRAQSLSNMLSEKGWPAAYISGSQDQQHRLTAMAKLKNFKCRVLVSTDLTSRGIDAEHVNLVVNLDLPRDHETYLHRIGRAGRFGSYGAGVTLVSAGTECSKLREIERQCKTRIVELPDPVSKDLCRSSGYVNIDKLVSMEKIITAGGSKPNNLDAAAKIDAISTESDDVTTNTADTAAKAGDVTTETDAIVTQVEVITTMADQQNDPWHNTKPTNSLNGQTPPAGIWLNNTCVEHETGRSTVNIEQDAADSDVVSISHNMTDSDKLAGITCEEPSAGQSAKQGQQSTMQDRHYAISPPPKPPRFALPSYVRKTGTRVGAWCLKEMVNELEEFLSKGSGSADLLVKMNALSLSGADENAAKDRRSTESRFISPGQLELLENISQMVRHLAFKDQKLLSVREHRIPSEDMVDDAKNMKGATAEYIQGEVKVKGELNLEVEAAHESKVKNNIQDLEVQCQAAESTETNRVVDEIELKPLKGNTCDPKDTLKGGSHRTVSPPSSSTYVGSNAEELDMNLGMEYIRRLGPRDLTTDSGEETSTSSESDELSASASEHRTVPRKGECVRPYRRRVAAQNWQSASKSEVQGSRHTKWNSAANDKCDAKVDYGRCIQQDYAAHHYGDTVNQNAPCMQESTNQHPVYTSFNMQAQPSGNPQPSLNTKAPHRPFSHWPPYNTAPPHNLVQHWLGRFDLHSHWSAAQHQLYMSSQCFNNYVYHMQWIRYLESQCKAWKDYYYMWQMCHEQHAYIRGMAQKQVLHVHPKG